MKAKWTETAGELFDLMKARGVDRDSCIGTILILAVEAKYKKMLQWINENPNAGQSEILGELDFFKKFYAAKKAPAMQKSVSQGKSRKIAAVL